MVLHGREIDILIPSYQIGIEYNGLRFHTDKEKGYHLWKTEEAQKAGYRLIHIWSDLWETRRTQTVDYLNKVFGRYTLLESEDVIEISPQEGTSFIEATHILGNDLRAKKYFGIYYEGNLITAASFDENWILLRISDRRTLKIKNDTEVITSYIKKKYSVNRVFAELDRSLFNSLPGFKLKNYTAPHCYWTKDYKERLQEGSEDLRKAGFVPFYDCGKIILEKSLS